MESEILAKPLFLWHIFKQEFNTKLQLCKGMTMVKKILLLSGLCLGGLLSASDSESIIMNNVYNLLGLLQGLRHSSDLSLESRIKTDFDTACADLEQLKNNNKISEANYNTHHTWLHQEFKPTFKSLRPQSNQLDSKE